MVFQGAPGAGKTALLHECKKKAESAQWRTAYIQADAFYAPSALTNYLKGRYTRPTVTELIAGVSSLIQLLRNKKPAAESSRIEHRLYHILKKAARRRGLVLILDEAQELQEEVLADSQTRIPVRRCLKAILNGDLGAPVILLCGGLGNTAAVLEKFGLSRHFRNNVHLLGALDDESAQAVVHDWLVRAGGIPAVDPNIRQWACTLASESQNWPHHLHGYAYEAVTWVQTHGVPLPAEVPAPILAHERTSREQYYAARLRNLRRQACVNLAELVRDTGKGGSLSQENIESVFPASATTKQGRTLFEELLYKGLITENASKLFAIPIPAMHDWLVQNFAAD